MIMLSEELERTAKFPTGMTEEAKEDDDGDTLVHQSL